MRCSSGWLEFICLLSVLGWSQPTTLMHLTALVGGFHEQEFALESGIIAFIFFSLANEERTPGRLDLNKMWFLSCCSSNSEEPENQLMAFKTSRFVLTNNRFWDAL